MDLGHAHLPQGNFDSIFRSIATIFRLLTFDNWDVVRAEPVSDPNIFAQGFEP